MLDDFWEQYDLENADFADLEEMEASKLQSLEFAKIFLKETTLDPLFAEYPFSLPMININNGDTLWEIERYEKELEKQMEDGCPDSKY